MATQTQVAEQAVGAYLVNLSYSNESFGGASMTLQLLVNAVSKTLYGHATGTILEGAHFQKSFVAGGTGKMYSTGLKPFIKVGGIEGEAFVSAQPPLIGTHIGSFSATFSVDNNWEGTGQLSIGDRTYECEVKPID